MSFSFSKNSLNSEISSNGNNNNDLLLCPKCKLIPKILINELKEEVTYICKSNKKIYSLNYFINNINNINKNDIIINTKCSLHSKKFISYCNTCKLNLCPDCKNMNIKNNKDINININHSNHDIIEFKAINPTGSNINKKRRILESLKKNLNKANLIFEEYVSNIKYLWKKFYLSHNNLIEFKEKIIDTYTTFENNFNSINNLSQIFNEIKFVNKPFDFINEIILNKSVKNTIKKIEDIFKIKNYGHSNVDEINIEEIFDENKNNNLNTSTSTQKPFSVIKSMINVIFEENNQMKEYLICGLSSGILKIYDTNPKFNFKKNIYLYYNKQGFFENKEINYMTEIYKNDYENKSFNIKKNKLYLLICTNDLEMVEISKNFENYSIIQKIGEPNNIYDKALHITLNNIKNNEYILANSNWISFLNIYKLNSTEDNNKYKLLSKLNDSEEIITSFILSKKENNIFEILCANYIENESKFFLVFYKINENDIIEKTHIKTKSFINEQDCIVKFNEYMAGVIIGKYINFDYENSSNNINNGDNNNIYINGISLIDLVNKQIITIIENPYYISKIFNISGGIFIYNSKMKKINLLKYENQRDKYHEIILNKIKFYFDTENLEFCIEDIYENNININDINNNIEDEPIFLVELIGGAIALGKNQKIKIFK